MKEHEKASGSDPTRLKAAVCADLLTKLCYGLGQYAPVTENFEIICSCRDFLSLDY
jgi:hypothetical protein